MDGTHGVLLLSIGLTIILLVGCIIAYFHKDEKPEQKEDNPISNFWKDFDGK